MVAVWPDGLVDVIYLESVEQKPTRARPTTVPPTIAASATASMT
jgi:hypothetical protein